jgi:hypothetical protein
MQRHLRSQAFEPSGAAERTCRFPSTVNRQQNKENKHVTKLFALSVEIPGSGLSGGVSSRVAVAATKSGANDSTQCLPALSTQVFNSPFLPCNGFFNGEAKLSRGVSTRLQRAGQVWSGPHAELDARLCRRLIQPVRACCRSYMP